MHITHYGQTFHLKANLAPIQSSTTHMFAGSIYRPVCAGGLGPIWLQPRRQGWEAIPLAGRGQHQVLPAGEQRRRAVAREGHARRARAAEGAGENPPNQPAQVQLFSAASWRWSLSVSTWCCPSSAAHADPDVPQQQGLFARPCLIKAAGGRAPERPLRPWAGSSAHPPPQPQASRPVGKLQPRSGAVRGRARASSLAVSPFRTPEVELPLIAGQVDTFPAVPGRWVMGGGCPPCSIRHLALAPALASQPDLIEGGVPRGASPATASAVSDRGPAPEPVIQPGVSADPVPEGSLLQAQAAPGRVRRQLPSAPPGCPLPACRSAARSTRPRRRRGRLRPTAQIQLLALQLQAALPPGRHPTGRSGWGAPRRAGEVARVLELPGNRLGVSSLIQGCCQEH